MTERLDRMKDSSPDYYSRSTRFQAIQAAQAAEYDRLEAQKDDLALQGSPVTATWGLKYYEAAGGIPTVESDSYDIRRSRVLSKRRGVGQFSAAMIERMAEAYSGGDVSATLDLAAQIIKVTFIGKLGIPPNLDDLKAAIDNVIHAHLGITYTFTYVTFGMLQTSGKTFGDIEMAGITFGELESWDEAKGG